MVKRVRKRIRSGERIAAKKVAAFWKGGPTPTRVVVRRKVM